jgi:hypothetical protein
MTSSLCVVRTINNPASALNGSNYLSYGGVTFTRTYAPLNWVELWIGFLVGWDPEYFVSSSTVGYSCITGDVRNSPWSIGIYNSSGSFPNDSILTTGSVVSPNTRYVSHSICVDYNTGASSILKTATSPSGSQFLTINYLATLWKDNVNINGGSSGNVLIPYNTDDYRYHVIRFVRSPASAATTMSMNYLVLSDTEFTNDMNSRATSSALLAEAMKQLTWVQVTTKFKGNYSQGSSLGGAASSWYVNETLSGSFDKIFFSWNNSLSPWRIKDVIVRASGSF